MGHILSKASLTKHFLHILQALKGRGERRRRRVRLKESMYLCDCSLGGKEMSSARPASPNTSCTTLRHSRSKYSLNKGGRGMEGGDRKGGASSARAATLNTSCTTSRPSRSEYRLTLGVCYCLSSEDRPTSSSRPASPNSYSFKILKIKITPMI